MSDALKVAAVNSTKTFCDRVAGISVILAFGTPFVAFLILEAMTTMNNHKRATPAYEHFYNYFVVSVFYCVFASEVAGFVLGIVSLIGSRKRVSSFWLAFLGVLASGCLGFICYRIVRYGIGGSIC